MSWELRLGSCLDEATGMPSMAAESVDVTITDPPYSEYVDGNSMRSGDRWRGTQPIERKHLEFAPMNAEVMAAAAKEIGRVTRRWALVFCDVESSHLWRDALEASGLQYVRTGAWIKIGGTPQFSGDRPAVGFEAIVIAHRPGKKTWNGGGKHGVWSVPIELDRNRKGTRVHPTMKPLGLMEHLVRDFTAPGELVCDPFSGSGTTGVAALVHGRRFIGWEREPKYHAAAVKRLSVAREQLDIFEERSA